MLWWKISLGYHEEAHEFSIPVGMHWEKIMLDEVVVVFFIDHTKM